MRWLTYRVFTALGWRVEGALPDEPRMVVVGAPHTSNWDFFLFLAALHHLDIRVSFLAKHTLFRWPIGYMFRAIGGIPVDRSRPGGITDQVTEAFDARDEMILVITPEGTRRAAPQWKSGFVKIAEHAGVPVVLAGVDSAHKMIVIGPALQVGAEYGELMDDVRAFYADKDGIHPKLKGPIRLSEESPAS